MRTLLNREDNSADAFASTHWSVIAAAGKPDSDPALAQRALSELCQTYWPPLYSYARSRGYSVHDAQDITQTFFGFLIEKRIYTRVDQRKGKFRSFLRASIKNFLADRYDHHHAQKRGGGQEPFPFDEERMQEVEASFRAQTKGQPATAADRIFERTWAETLINDSLATVALHYAAEGKEEIFQQLKFFLTGSSEPVPTYGKLAAQLGLKEPTLRSHITRLRARYREALRAEVRRTVAREAEVEDELRELLRVLMSD